MSGRRKDGRDLPNLGFCATGYTNSRSHKQLRRGESSAFGCNLCTTKETVFAYTRNLPQITRTNTWNNNTECTVLAINLPKLFTSFFQHHAIHLLNNQKQNYQAYRRKQEGVQSNKRTQTYVHCCKTRHQQTSQFTMRFGSRALLDDHNVFQHSNEAKRTKRNKVKESVPGSQAQDLGRKM